MSRKGKNNKLIGCCLFIIAITLLGIIIVKNCISCDSESYKSCVCSSNYAGRGKVCQDVDEVWKNYNNGMTEYQDFPNKGWTTISPGDYDFPKPEGNCECK